MNPTTQRYIPEDSNPQWHCCGSLKSQTWEFIAVLIKARHLSLSRATVLKSTPSHPILMMSSQLHADLPRGHCPSGSVFLCVPIRVTCPTQILLLVWSSKQCLLSSNTSHDDWVKGKCRKLQWVRVNCVLDIVGYRKCSEKMQTAGCCGPSGLTGAVRVAKWYTERWRCEDSVVLNVLISEQSYEIFRE